MFRISRLSLSWICIGVLVATAAVASPAPKHKAKHGALPADSTVALSSRSDSTHSAASLKPGGSGSAGGGGIVLHHGVSKVPYLIAAGAGAVLGAGAILHGGSHSSAASSQASTSTTGGNTPSTPPGGIDPPTQQNPPPGGNDPPTQQNPPTGPEPLLGTGGSQAPASQPQAPEPSTLPLLCIALAAWACYSTLKK